MLVAGVGTDKENLVPYGTPISSTRMGSSYDAANAFDGSIYSQFWSSASTNCFIGMDFGKRARLLCCAQSRHPSMFTCLTRSLSSPGQDRKALLRRMVVHPRLNTDNTFSSWATDSIIYSKFEGSNDASAWTTIYTVDEEPPQVGLMRQSCHSYGKSHRIC